MKFNKIFNAFPPPEFLNMSYAGLSISDNHVRCLQFERVGGRLIVSKYIEKLIPVGIVVSGLINNVPELVNILQSIKKELKVNRVKVSLPEEKGYLFTTNIPKVESKEVRSTIEFKMEENVPVPTADLFFDYTIADKDAHPDHLNVIVSALPNVVVDKYIEAVHTAGFSLLSLEIESQAIARAVIKKGDHTTHLIVHFGKEKVGLYVAYHRVVHFTSTIPIKGRSKEDLTMLSQEIKKLYMYWHTLKENAGIENKKINHIIICGENITDDVLTFISQNTKTESTLANVWTNAFDINNFVPQILFTDSLRFAPAVGLALPSDILI